MKKRVIAVLLSAMMITSMAPVSAMASFDDGTEVQVADEFTGADETGDIFADQCLRACIAEWNRP